MSLGTVIHTVTSDDGSYTFRASEEWEALEIAPGGYEGAKEVISPAVFRKHPHIFTRNAWFHSFHEQSGACIFGGKIRDYPVENSGRVDLGVKGNALIAARKLTDMVFEDADVNNWTHSASSSLGIDSPADERELLFVVDAKASGGVLAGAYNYAYYNASGGLKQVEFIFGLTDTSDSPSPLPSGHYEVVVDVYDPIQDATFEEFRQDVSTMSSTFFTIDFTQSVGSYIEIRIETLITGAKNKVEFHFQDLRVRGVADSHIFSDSAVVKHLSASLGLRYKVDEFGFNVLPLRLQDQTYLDGLLLMGLFANARHLILDTGTRPYLEFSRWNKRVWDTGPNSDSDPLPLEPYDRLTVGFKYNNGHRDHWTYVSDRPLETPNSYGRISLASLDPYGTITVSGNDEEQYARVQNTVSNALEHLRRQRWGGSGQLADVRMEGELFSGFLLHAGDVLHIPEDRAHVRVARKSSTIRGITWEAETNYAPLDRLEERGHKIRERAA